MPQTDRKFMDFPCPSITPWGEPQSKEKIADGIWLISTSGHGGIWVAPDRVAKMDSALLRSTFVQQGKNGWFEEDCDAIKVQRAFPEEFAKWMRETGRG